MAVTLTVSEVRAAIYFASQHGQTTGGERETGAASTAQLGRIFHEVFAALVGADAQRNLHAALDEAEPDAEEWRRALVRHTYEHLFGPRLRRAQATLHSATDQTLTCWDAVQELCAWLAEIFWQLRARGSEWRALDLVRVEQALEWELKEPDWRDAVRVVGTADAVWQLPATARWCVVELKTGRVAPEADLAQACLYHQMLTQAGEMAGELSLVSFTPQPRERFFTAVEISAAQTKLRDLIGRLAGVSPNADERSENPKVSSIAPDVRSAVISPNGAAAADYAQLGQQLAATLAEYGARVELEDAPIVGPTFLRFPVTLGSRVKLRQVQQLAQELQVRLRLAGAPRIGTEGGSVVVDLQRPDRQTILFSQVRDQLPAPDPLLGCARAPLGVDLAGRLRLINFSAAEDAHLLVAGTTGSGKSEWLRAAVAGLLATNTPETLRLLIIDPKRNAFHALRRSPFLLEPIVFPDEQPAAAVLTRLADLMDSRYALLGEAGDDTLGTYIERTGRPVPRVFCICDEYADLIDGDRKTRQAIEQQVARLGQKARAAGIHLILATQQPSRQIIKGALDANIPARVGLKMQKGIESQMLLNTAGAESLLGRGDLLFKDIGDPVRLQGVYLPPDEAQAIFEQ